MGSDTRQRILERRARFLVAALSSVSVTTGVAVGCSDESVTEPQPCLSVDAAPVDTSGDSGAQPCLSPQPPDTNPLPEVGTTSPPTLTPPPGSYPAPVTVTIAAPDPGSVIYYTADGTTPNRSSPKYAAPLTISSSQKLQAMAAAPGLTESMVVGGDYVISPDAGVDAASD